MGVALIAEVEKLLMQAEKDKNKKKATKDAYK